MQQIPQLRLWNQQLVCQKFSTPAEVVRWFGAVQSQDLPGSLYAVGRRMKSATETQVEAAIANKSMARSWPMRGTIHFVPSEDLRWMTALLSERSTVKAASNYRRAELTPQEITKAGQVITNQLAGAQLTRPQIYNALNKAGIDTGSRNGEQRGMHLLVHWACRGLICITPRQGKQPTFALVEEWLPAGRDLKGNNAITELGKTYFQSHGPATLKDFLWWTGLTMTELKPNIAVITKDLEKLEVNGIEYWFTPSGHYSNSDPSVIMLPNFDEYTVAYADRTAVADKDILKKLSHGLAPNIIVNGQIAGTWRRTIKKDSVIIEAKLIGKLNIDKQQALASEAKSYGEFLGLKADLVVA